MPHVFIRILKRSIFCKGGLAFLLLAGCVTHPTKHIVSDSGQDKIPASQVADYLSIECARIWSLPEPSADNNPLYWLRAIDCAERMMPAQSRSAAGELHDDSWQDTFKRGILLANARITPPERREMVGRMDAFSSQIPLHVRPLYQLWRDGQTQQLQLAVERQRYIKLQQSSDSDLDALRQQQQQLQAQLDLTTRKLENLTDIERQLSTRKPAGSYTPDTTHGVDKSALPDNGASSASPNNEVMP
ncbi:TPA: two-component system QseEF-associated lipoprotein QseG [Citrobacter freundii]